jgi:hypothetical protein
VRPGETIVPGVLLPRRLEKYSRHRENAQDGSACLRDILLSHYSLART